MKHTNTHILLHIVGNLERLEEILKGSSEQS